MKIVIKKKPEPKLEVEECEQHKLKVNMDIILKLREEAERQKLHRNTKAFAKTLGNEGKDVPNLSQESTSQLDKIAESFEIIEE